MQTLWGLILVTGKFALPIAISLAGLVGAVLIGHVLTVAWFVYLGLYAVLTALITLIVLIVGVAYESPRP